MMEWLSRRWASRALLERGPGLRPRLLVDPEAALPVAVVEPTMLVWLLPVPPPPEPAHVDNVSKVINEIVKRK